MQIFDNSAYTMYVLPESASNGEDIENYPPNRMSGFDNFTRFCLYNVAKVFD